MNESQKKEIIIKAITVSAGTVIGSSYIYKKNEVLITPKKIDERETALHFSFFNNARKELIKRWSALQEKETNRSTKNIIDAQIEMLRDPELIKRIETLIKDERYNAQYAVQQTFEDYIDFFSKTGSPVIADRIVDIGDLQDRLIIEIGEKKLPEIEITGNIVVAKELSAREVIALSHKKVKGIILERGGETAHSAIIARSLNIPMVIGAKNATEIINNDETVCLAGSSGNVYINPKQTTRTRIERLANAKALSEKEKENLCRIPFETADGCPFTLRANIEFPVEIEKMEQCRPKGVGLLRTEAIYLNRSKFGDREEQQKFYEKVLLKADNQPVTIRLFDVGGDKFQGEKISENNPFLGWRGIRMLLDERQLLREQLLAIMATAAHHPGRVKLLLPMVTMIEEIEQMKEEIEHCRQILAREGQTDISLPLGIMAETPNVALQSVRFAKKVDFFSIGTNDLIQYLLAVDRGNERVSYLYRQIHPVMWQVIAMIIENAHRQNIEVEVCGELASYPVAAACLTGLGIDGLSMNPAAVLPVKKLLTNRTMDELEALADQTRQCETVNEVETLFDNWKIKIND
ncbi:MAG TPA: phosphoenolpyruvate--protein phosphotransferase [Balneolaceae bacterium]|nr:phosphoenolpyruvate--protein phosphotransferase [Balneolaceae bacterium]